MYPFPLRGGQPVASAQTVLGVLRRAADVAGGVG
jgi:hypothetical protein